MDNKLHETDNTLNSLAQEVLKKYDLIPENISLVQSGTIKTVWKFRTRDGSFCLKRLKQSYDKALFSVNAQIYIKKAGGNVPHIIFDRTKQPIVQYNNQLFVVYEWLQGKDLNFGNSEDLRIAIQGLARFHAASKGYKPVENARSSTKLAKWPEQYNSMKSRMIAWKEVARNKEAVPGNAAYLSHVDSMVELANQALELLEKTHYRELTAPDSASIVLCHQDYGTGNAISTNSGVYVLDLDGVTFDLSARDLRKIIGKLAQNKAQWDINTIENILGWYGSVNPINQKEKEILYVDLLFPHWFFGLLKNQFDNDKQLKPGEIERTAKLELSKKVLLNDLIKRSHS